ncbi:hypothetical protein [Merismopedia glauca]|uniref:Uncharacterized protein n=1 Tax=Merismopedia glauca CCAP 1448/3 TaxID=1296344 RepID=A0A2T1BYI3_9CYAN|nr:hypothetical protein [Merismopedia glauca]PSB00958.1 hypothetical protein C7B64_20840 [Merismopedia glauca CCAP 1448/3]
MKAQKLLNNIVNAGLMTSVILLSSDIVLAGASDLIIDANTSKDAKEVSIVPNHNSDLHNNISSHNAASIYPNGLTTLIDFRNKDRKVCALDIKVVFKDEAIGERREFNVCSSTGTTIHNAIGN